jgi:hypothetical protein
MTTLERRCRFLLHIYPAAYRRDRAEEMLGTLLQTTPPHRTWPLPRDTWALLLGGLRARGSQDRRLSIPGNLRLAALLGCTIFLSFTAVDDAGRIGWRAGVSWQPLILAVLILTAAVLPWLAGRKAAALGAAAAGTATVACSLSSFIPTWNPNQDLYAAHPPGAGNAMQILVVLIPLAALVLLARGTERPPLLWLWLPGLVIALAVPAVAQWVAMHAVSFSQPDPYLWLVPFGVAIAWIGIDARPAIGLAAGFSLWLGQALVTNLCFGGPTFNWGPAAAENWWFISPTWWFMYSPTWWGEEWKWLTAVLVLAVLALQRVRRQAVL